MARKSKFRLFIVILLAVLLFLAVLAGGGLFFLNRYLNSSGFLDKVRQEAQSSLGLPVRMETLRVSIFSGLSVRGFSLASPVAGNPPLVRAEKIKISYRLRPLLDRKVQVDEILLVSPRFDLRADERGELELPRKPAASHPRGSKERSARKKKEPAVSSPWTVEIKNLRVKSASGSFRGPDYTITVSGMNLDTSLRYRLHAYLHQEMIAALHAADLVVARAGASTLGEFPALGLPAILVPLPISGGHQHYNAEYLADRGAAIIVENDTMPDDLLPAILSLSRHPDKLAAMSEASAALARPDAARDIARVLLDLGRSS